MQGEYLIWDIFFPLLTIIPNIVQYIYNMDVIIEWS